VARYLLSSQSLLDIARRQGRPAEKWLESATEQGVDARDVCISAVAPMNVLGLVQAEIAKAAASRTPSALLAWRTLEDNIRNYVLDLAADDRIVPMDHHIAERWGILLDCEIQYIDPAGVPYAIGSAEKLEIATAMIGRHGIPFIYVAEKQDVHATLAELVVESP
jgi:predicted nucleic acid-binding protein